MISRLGNSQYNYSNKIDLAKKNEINKTDSVSTELKNAHPAKISKQVSFSGSGMPVVDGIIGFITWMENGGKAVEFTVTDCLAMIFPRTFQAYNRNSKELGHPNYKAGTEEALREFLTGPSMFLVPLGLVGLGNKIFGESSGIGFNKLRKFGETFTGLVSKNGANKTEFYKEILKEAVSEKLAGKDPTEHISVIIKNMEKIDELNKKIVSHKEGRHIGHGLILFIDEKIVKTSDFLAAKFPKLNGANSFIKKHIGGNVEILEKRANLDKQIKESFNAITGIITKINSDSAISSETIGHIISPDNVLLNCAGKTKKFSASAKELITDMMKFGNDIVAKTESVAKDSQGKIAEKLFAQRHGGRIITIATAIASTATFLYCIPMLYKRNKQYPGIDGLVKQTNATATSKSAIVAKITNNPLLKIYTASKGGNA